MGFRAPGRVLDIDGREVHSATVPGCRPGGSHLMNAIGRHPLFAEPTASFCRIAGVAIFIQHVAERHADLRIARTLDRRKILLAVEGADVLPADLNSREFHDALRVDDLRSVTLDPFWIHVNWTNFIRRGVQSYTDAILRLGGGRVSLLAAAGLQYP
jgi:hypothetical protein